MIDLSNWSSFKKWGIMLLAFFTAFIATLFKDLGYEIFSFLAPFPYQNQLAHFSGAGVISFLITVFTKKRMKWRFVRISPLIGLLALLSVIEEISQLLRINRGFSYTDILMNVLGVATFAFLAQILLDRRIIIR